MFKKIGFLITFCLFLNCSDSGNLANCIRTFNVSIGADLNNPGLINAQTPGGFANLPGGNKGILLFNKNGTDFVAFDKFCPQADCDAAMVLENRLLKCTCDNTTYSVDFGGTPQTDGVQCPAIEYRVTKNGSTIRITNF